MQVSKEHSESSEKNIALQREVTSLRKDKTLLERDKVLPLSQTLKRGATPLLDP